MKNFHDLVKFAEAENFYVTATTNGRHNVGSKHYLGLAIDVRTYDKTAAQITEFMAKAQNVGIIVRDE